MAKNVLSPHHPADKPTKFQKACHHRIFNSARSLWRQLFSGFVYRIRNQKSCSFTESFKNTLPWGNLISFSPHLGSVAVVNVTAGPSLCCRSRRQLRGLITLSGALRLTGDLQCRLTRLCFNARWSGGLIAEDSPLCAEGWPLPLYVTELRQTCREMKHYSLISSFSCFTTKALFSSLFFCLSTLERLWKCSCIGITV